MKTELQKFIRKEPASKFIGHFIFLYQLYLLQSQHNKENESNIEVFPVLLEYIAWGMTSKNKEIRFFMDGIADKIEKLNG